MNNISNEEILSKLIVGRVKPHIYVFSTNTIPNYLKVGDTYRPVLTRLREWKKYFPNLKKEFEDLATINEDVFFRDYSVHQYLETDLNKHRLEPNEYPSLYYSNEFFENVRTEHITEAINDIKNNYKEKTGKYKYYDAKNQLPETFTYASTGEWKPRPNQLETIKRFVSAVQSGRKNLLMYAVMRFGKSFTSLCCAKEIKAQLVLVLSGKADVREEWKKTVQSADNFNKDYVFLSGDDLSNDQSIVKTTIANGKKVVLFLTLQDLQGESIKDKHKEVFGQQIDLLIVDETHYGARAERYGEVIRTVNYEKDIKEKYADDDFVDIKDAEEQIKSLAVKITLHLSGTPYRILMGSEFQKEDIIAFYQFSDIVKDQEAWDKEHLLEDSKDIKEWENPYYGFPQMVRFAFVPSKAALAILEELKSNGTTYAFSALFKPRSIKKDKEHANHKKFVYEKEVLELFEVIDGCKNDEGLLSFLDYEKIKEGKMCQHIVCVLPYCASCDALEKLIHDNRSKFKNLNDYTIINISGVDSAKNYKTVQSIKTKIHNCAAENKKTLTLTVNRMLTGSTVEEWDTMIFLKDTSSPQEYDQAIFRLQNQYIKEYIDEDGDAIKYNMKPQTLLVDFAPHRMFVMQEQKSQIYNANTDTSGNEHLKNRIEEELRISPIITLNKNKIEQVNATDILEEISEYSSNRGVLEETKDIPVDMSLLSIDSIKSAIEEQAELGSKKGLSIEAHKGEEKDLDTPDKGKSEDDDDEDYDEKEEEQKGKTKEDELKIIENKFRTYYSRILFFAFLTKNKITSLENIIQCIENGENKRIAKNLKLEKNILSLIKSNINIFILRQIDYKIQNINTLSRDNQLQPMERASIAIRKFGRISESEVTTPEHIAKEMIGLIPDCFFKKIEKESDKKILDIASKMGEFAIAIVHRCEKLGISFEKIKNNIISIPTSSIAYEFTRKVYEILKLDVSNIEERFTTYDLLKIRKVKKDGSLSDSVDYSLICKVLSQGTSMSKNSLEDLKNKKKVEDKMKFSAIVGNPPYQEADGGAAASSKPIYQHFVNISKKLEPSFASLIIPCRWFTGGKGLKDFRKSMLEDIHIKELHDCLHPEEIFPETNNRGGICYFLWDKNYDNTDSKVKVVTHKGNNKLYEKTRTMKTRDLDIFIRNSEALSILDKVIPNNSTEVMVSHISPRKPFGLEGNIVDKEDFHLTPDNLKNPVKCYGKAETVGFVESDLITSSSEWINCWKVYMPYANNIGTELNDDNQNTFVGEPNSICTETFLAVGLDDNLNEKQCINLANYLRTKFARFLLSVAKISQHGTSKTYIFVPYLDFSEKWTDSRLYKKYKLTSDEISIIENSIKTMKSSL